MLIKREWNNGRRRKNGSVSVTAGEKGGEEMD